jgi:hypothetical protein
VDLPYAVAGRQNGKDVARTAILSTRGNSLSVPLCLLVLPAHDADRMEDFSLQLLVKLNEWKSF